MFVITAVHMDGYGEGYEHIETVRYRLDNERTAPPGNVARVDQVVGWLRSGIEVWSEGNPPARVEIGRNGHREFIRTKADSLSANNLLSLPRF